MKWRSIPRSFFLSFLLLVLLVVIVWVLQHRVFQTVRGVIPTLAEVPFVTMTPEEFLKTSLEPSVSLRVRKNLFQDYRNVLKQAMSEKRLELAHSIILHAQKLFPDERKVYLNLAEIEGILGHRETAFKLTQLATEKKNELYDDPDNATLAVAYNNLANMLVNEGKAKEAKKYLESAIKAKEDLAPPHYLLGSLEYASGNFVKSAQEFRRAFELDPTSATVQDYLDFGAVSWQTGNVEQAQTLLAEALKRFPLVQGLRTTRGLLFLKKGDLETAYLEFMEETFLFNERNPYLQVAVTEVGKIQQRMKDEQLQKSFLVLYAFLEGRKLRAKHQLAKAVKFLRAVVTDRPSQAVYWYYLGETLALSKKWEEARQAFQKCVDLDRYFVPAYMALGDLYAQDKNVDSAQKMWQEGRRLNPTNWRVELHNEMQQRKASHG